MQNYKKKHCKCHYFNLNAQNYKKKKRNPKYYFGLNTQKYKNKILHHTILLTKYLFIQDIF